MRTDSGHLLTDYKSRVRMKALYLSIYLYIYIYIYFLIKRGLATILSGESDHVISLGASGDRGKREKRTVPAVQDEITPAPSFRLNVPRAMRSSLTFGVRSMWRFPVLKLPKCQFSIPQTSFVPEEDKAAADKRQWLRELGSLQ